MNVFLLGFPMAMSWQTEEKATIVEKAALTELYFDNAGYGT